MRKKPGRITTEEASPHSKTELNRSDLLRSSRTRDKEWSELVAWEEKERLEKVVALMREVAAHLVAIAIAASIGSTAIAVLAYARTAMGNALLLVARLTGQ